MKKYVIVDFDSTSSFAFGIWAFLLCLWEKEHKLSSFAFGRGQRVTDWFNCRSKSVVSVIVTWFDHYNGCGSAVVAYFDHCSGRVVSTIAAWFDYCSKSIDPP